MITLSGRLFHRLTVLLAKKFPLVLQRYLCLVSFIEFLLVWVGRSLVALSSNFGLWAL